MPSAPDSAEKESAASTRPATTEPTATGSSGPVTPTPGDDGPTDSAGGLDGSLGLGGTGAGGSEDGPDFDNMRASDLSLADHLMAQAGASVDGADLFIAAHLIDQIDEAGYLTASLLDIASRLNVPLARVEAVLATIHTFDPTGVGARNLAECMLIQAMACGQDDDLVVKMIRSHLGNLEKKNYQAIARDLKQPLEEIYEAAKVIMDFDPRPGRQYSTDDPHYVTPDVYIHKVGDKYFVVPNDDGLPKLKISNFYKAAMGNSTQSKGQCRSAWRGACRRSRA